MDQTIKDAPLERWTRKLAEEEMPVFAQTVGEINRILAKEEFSSLTLARVILQDPSMTAKVLRLANSAFYNPGGSSISTISRAVLVLGFQVVQAICITIAIIESLVQGPAKERVMRELARSIHAATQARKIALCQKDPTSEEVFIAALLLNLGQMAFWCFAGEEGEPLDQAMQSDPWRNPPELEQETLGFCLADLTSALVRKWKLTALVEEAMKGPLARDPRAKWIDLGHRIAREAEKGWTGEKMQGLVGEVAQATSKNSADAGDMLGKCAGEAVEAARAMGAKAAAELIPTAEEANGRETTWEVQPQSPWPLPDPLLQLKILRDITSTMVSKPDLNVILEMVLEGIHRGVGMDRTVLALVAPGRRIVKAKQALGADRQLLMDKFWFELAPRGPFVRAMESEEATWFYDYVDGRATREPIFEAISRANFFATPVVYSGQTIGLFYADRHPSARALDAEAFESFKLFAHQANLGLEHVARIRAVAAAATAPK